jgi:hypothetical protein
METIDSHDPEPADCGKEMIFQACNALPELPVRIYWTAGKDIRFPLNRHPEIEIHYIRHSRGDYLIDGVHYPFWPNTLLVIPPGATHQRNVAPNVYTESAALVFSLDQLREEVPGLKAADLPRCVRLSIDEGIVVESLMRLISVEIHGRKDNWQNNLNRVLGILIDTIRRWRNRTAPQPVRNPVAIKAVKYIEDHPPAMNRD